MIVTDGLKRAGIRAKGMPRYLLAVPTDGMEVVVPITEPESTVAVGRAAVACRAFKGVPATLTDKVSAVSSAVASCVSITKCQSVDLRGQWRSARVCRVSRRDQIRAEQDMAVTS